MALLPVLITAGWGVTPLAAQETASPGRTISLTEAVQTALERNHQLSAARFQLAESDQLVREAWGNVYPKVNLSTTYTRNLEVTPQFLPAIILDPDADPNAVVPVRFGSDNSWFGELRLEQPLLQAGAFVGVGAAARYRALQTEQVRGTVQNVITSVRETYYGVLLAEEGVRLNTNSVQRVRQTLDETRAMYRAGLASSYDVLRLEVQLTNLETGLRRAENSAAAARRNLAVALGLPPSEPITTAGSLATVRLEDGAENTPENRVILGLAGLDDPERMEPEALLQTAVTHRSDLLQLGFTRELRRTELRYEQVQYLPQISLFGSYTLVAQNDGAPGFFGTSGRRADGQQVGIRVSVPVFTGMQRPARIGQKRAALNQTNEQYTHALAQAESQIRTLSQELRDLRERADAQRRAIEQAQRGYDIVRAQFREGLSSHLEVTDAENALRESEFNYAQAVYDYFVARARLDQATGVVPSVDTGSSR